VVLVEAPAATPIVFVRYADGWAEPAQSTYYEWEKVCSYGTPVRYVPDPFADPVGPRWTDGGREMLTREIGLFLIQEAALSRLPEFAEHILNALDEAGMLSARARREP
jgi:hypothetical protein